ERGDARGRWMEPKLERIEVEAALGYDHDLTVDHAAARQPLDQGIVQVGKVPVEWPQVPALNIDISAVPEDDRAEAVPFGLEEERSGLRQYVRQPGEHGLDRRLHGSLQQRPRGRLGAYRPRLACGHWRRLLFSRSGTETTIWDIGRRFLLPKSGKGGCRS